MNPEHLALLVVSWDNFYKSLLITKFERIFDKIYQYLFQSYLVSLKFARKSLIWLVIAILEWIRVDDWVEFFGADTDLSHLYCLEFTLLLEHV